MKVGMKIALCVISNLVEEQRCYLTAEHLYDRFLSAAVAGNLDP
jgi:hypothetical protein